MTKLIIYKFQELCDLCQNVIMLEVAEEVSASSEEEMSMRSLASEDAASCLASAGGMACFIIS